MGPLFLLKYLIVYILCLVDIPTEFRKEIFKSEKPDWQRQLGFLALADNKLIVWSAILQSSENTVPAINVVNLLPKHLGAFLGGAGPLEGSRMWQQASTID